MAEQSSEELLSRVRAGNASAADELFHRFFEGLIALAAARLSAKLARRLDPEDVVQSAYRSFFLGAQQGRYVLKRSGDLWRLLVGITLHKLQHQVEHHTAAKRALAGEQLLAEDSLGGLADLVQARDPSPLEAAALADEVEQLLARLEPHQRPMLELRLQGHSLDEIAQQLQCSERTVRRTMDVVRKMLDGTC